MDSALKKDIRAIQMRNYLDPKRFYKNPDPIKQVLHVGTVIEGPTEFKSARMHRKERKQTIVDELLGDASIKQYAKRKYNELQEQNTKKLKFHKKSKKR